MNKQLQDDALDYALDAGDFRFWSTAESLADAREWLLSPGMVTYKTITLGITEEEWRALVDIALRDMAGDWHGDDDDQRDEDEHAYADTVAAGLDRWTR